MAHEKPAPYDRCPPVRKLMAALNIPLGTAQSVRAVLKGATDPRNVGATDRWVRQCYHEPSQREQARHAVDALLETHGIEVIEDSEGRVQAFYCNAGDAYAATLIFRGRECYIGCWGDVVEMLERRGAAFR